MVLSKLFHRAGVVIAAAMVSLGANAAVTTQLGFLWDESGSIAGSDFTTMKNGYLAAINALPTDGTVEVTIVSFAGTSTPTIVAPTVLTGATKAGIIAAINANTQANGSTPTGAGITAITRLMVGSVNYDPSLRSIINIATDGAPNDGTNNPQQTAIDAAIASEVAGIDALTAEFIGGGTSGGDFLRDIVFNPTTGPCNNCGSLLTQNSQLTDPMTGLPWVLQVNSFDDFEAAMVAKVAAVTGNIPEPSALALVGIALAGLGLSRRRAAAV